MPRAYSPRIETVSVASRLADLLGAQTFRIIPPHRAHGWGDRTRPTMIRLRFPDGPEDWTLRNAKEFVASHQRSPE